MVLCRTGQGLTMRNDQIFVLLLVVLLPLSGCFDAGGIGEAEGADESGETSETTVVNNYYNNTTIVESTTPLHHQFSNGTIVITTNPNEVVEVISLDAVRPSGSFSQGIMLGPYYSESWTSTWDALVNINCTMIDDNTIIDLGDSGLNYGGFATPDTLPSDGGLCIYTIQNQWDYSAWTGAPEGIWPMNGMISITYQIHSTV
jgi:hypothetical protein